MSVSAMPFADLPAALVEEVIGKTSEVSEMLLGAFRQVSNERTDRRQELHKKGLILNESSLGYPPLPTTCATDGSYAIERLLTADLAAAAAVAVEGLTPPSEARFWDQPRHSTFVAAEVHHAETATVLRAVMLGNELLLATRAPHDLVMVDSTLTLPLIYFNQALNQAPDSLHLKCSQEFLNNCCYYLEAFLVLLRPNRSDKNYAALPKYSTRREIGKEMNWPGEHDDRGMLTLLLQPGELTKPLPLEKSNPVKEKSDWHLNVSRVPKQARELAKELADKIIDGVDDVRVFYYKPHEWLPALRVEGAAVIADNKHRLASVVQGLTAVFSRIGRWLSRSPYVYRLASVQSLLIPLRTAVSINAPRHRCWSRTRFTLLTGR